MTMPATRDAFQAPPLPTPAEVAAGRRILTAAILGGKGRKAVISGDEKTVTYTDDRGRISILSIVTDPDGKFLHLDARHQPPEYPAETLWETSRRLFNEAEAWNLLHPIGTHITYLGQDAVTRSAAYPINGEISIYITGVKAFIPLSKISPKTTTTTTENKTP